MRVEVSFKHLEQSELVDNIIQKNLKKIERRIKIFKSDEAIHLSFHLEKNPHKDDYFCWINLYLPSKVLRAQRRRPTVSLAINESFAALKKQLSKFKYQREKHITKK